MSGVREYMERFGRWLMEEFRKDPSVTLDEWREQCRRWEETFGTPYERKTK